MSQDYITREGDMADYIAWKNYCTLDDRVVEQLLDANPGLADRGPILPAGVRITLPDLQLETAAEAVKLWD